MKTRYKNVTVDPDRHGKLRARFRKAGRAPVYMKHLPDEKGFKEEYQALLTGLPPIVIRTAKPGSVADLASRYYASGDFKGRGTADTQGRRKYLIESFREPFADDLVSDFAFEHIETILLDRTTKRWDEERKRMMGGQVAATKLRKELRRLFAYAKKLKWIDANPVEEATSIGKAKLTGFHTWSEDEIARYKARHPLGTRARLALEIMLWTGQRRGDARLFGPAHIVRGKINFVAAKNQADLWLPVAPDLRRAIDSMESIGLRSFLVTQTGSTFTKDGFGNKMREWCDQAGLPQCSAHGLRKAIGRRMAQSQATQLEIKAVGGWKGDTEVAIYTAAAEQEGLASEAIGRTIGRFSDTE